MATIEKYDICDICDNPILSDQSTITERGLPNIVKISEDLKDRLDEKLENKTLPIPVHKQCKKHYVMPSSVRKRKRETDSSQQNSSRKSLFRSQTPDFNIKQDCLYCGEHMDIEKLTKLPLARRKNAHGVETTELLSSVTAKAIQRGDSWGELVHKRVQNVGDLVAAEAKYHHDCQIRFHDGRGLEKRSKGRPTGCVDDEKSAAFLKLCEYLDASDKHQFSLTELHSLMKSFSDDNENYTAKHLKLKLQEHYRDSLIITCEPGRETIYTFLEKGNAILREHYKSTGLKPEDIIDMAATIIDDQMRSMIYDTSVYPKFSELESSEHMVSELLARFLSRLVKSKRRQIAISHCITAAARPRSFISPILLALSLYINSKLESRELVDLLSSLGFADDYREVLRLYSAMLPDDVKEYDWTGSLVNFVFDNADIDTRTLTGHGTWHAMGGIAGVTPAGQQVQPQLSRCTAVKSVFDSGKFAEIPLKRYRKPAIPALKQVVIGPLEPPEAVPMNLGLAKSLDMMWLTSYFVSDPVKCPSWSGFNQTVVRQGHFDISRIEILPFLNHNPTQLDTIYSALAYAQSLTEKYHLGVSPVTFDQPLYIKAVEIVQASTDLDNIFVRLGGFHLIMSYMGAIGNIMGGSGLQEQWETVYAPNSVKHMLSGHAYARALRAHMLSASSLVSEILNTPNCLVGVDIERLKTVHQMLIRGENDSEALLNENALQQVTDVLDDLMKELSMTSRTGKLWIEYIKMVRILLLFVRAERSGDWALHLFCVSKMIPVLHSGGHTAYAKSARLYLDQMKRMTLTMTKEHFEKYITHGYWTIRRSHRFWSGNFTDQTIEQVLMRMLKTRGGLAHGRGITAGTQSKFVHVLPQTVPICDSLESFCDVHSQTSDQHTDLRPTTTARDGTHFITFRKFLTSHSPFAYGGENHDSLVSISSGVVAPKCANADLAMELGEQSAARLTKQNYADAKLKRNDRVTSIAAATNTANVRGQDIEVDPSLLFMRVTCVINKPSDMENHLKYEFCQQPPALFNKGDMRKTSKSVLAQRLKVPVTPYAIHHLENPYFVVDGGHMLQTVIWPNSCTYGEVYDTYVNYVLHNYGMNCTICFDGYTNPSMSTKLSEQTRRTVKNVSADTLFDCQTRVTHRKELILANRSNKSRIIDQLKERLISEGLTCCQSQADADFLISSTALSLATVVERPVVLVGNDTDLLVMLIDKATTANIYMQYSKESVYNIQAIQQSMTPQVKQHILIGHAITGCDTTSALYGIGKKKAIDILNSGVWAMLDVFKQSDASADDIVRAGEILMLKLYKAKQHITSLDRLRYVQYMQVVSKKTTSFHLQTLPPTSAASKYHSLRSYYSVQEWLGNAVDLNPTEWGWEHKDSILTPVLTDRPIAPDEVLRIVSCGCKAVCSKKCKCRKSGLYCTPMCSACAGQTCTNACPPDSDDID